MIASAFDPEPQKKRFKSGDNAATEDGKLAIEHGKLAIEGGKLPATEDGEETAGWKWLTNEVCSKCVNYKTGMPWVRTKDGKWLTTEDGKWLTTADGKLAKNEDGKCLMTPLGMSSIDDCPWLTNDAGSKWMNTQTGTEGAGNFWVRTHGEWSPWQVDSKWVKTNDDGKWMNTEAGKWANTDDGEWANIENGKCATNDDSKWMNTEDVEDPKTAKVEQLEPMEPLEQALEKMEQLESKMEKLSLQPQICYPSLKIMQRYWAMQAQLEVQTTWRRFKVSRWPSNLIHTAKPPDLHYVHTHIYIYMTHARDPNQGFLRAAIMEEASGGGIMDEESWRRHRGGRHHGGGVWRRHRG